MAFTFKLETTDGTPADPPSFQTIAPMWRPGDMIPLGGRALRVVGVRATDVDETPVLIVDDVSERRLAGRAATSYASHGSGELRRLSCHKASPSAGKRPGVRLAARPVKS